MEDSAWRSHFVIEDPNLCYMDGNSLGRLPMATTDRMTEIIRSGWGSDLIRGWNADWIHLPRKIGSKISELVGCDPEEIVVADSTSINLYKLAAAALKATTEDRKKVLSDATNFPSDLHVLASAAQAAGDSFQLKMVGKVSDVEFPTNQLLKALDADTALVSLSHVAFRSGAMADMKSITQAAHGVGSMILWDLSHSVGAVPINLHESRVDLAVGCTYKYLCGGPGAPAFLYVRRDLQEKLSNPIQGWFSHRRPFDFDPHYEAAQSIDQFLTGTPPILSLAAIEAGVDLVAQAGISELRRRSCALTGLLIEQFDERLKQLGYELRSPRVTRNRGSHVSLGHEQARRITANLIDRHHVIPDFRPPDNIRLGIAPLYTTETEIRRTIDALEASVKNEEYRTVKVSNEPVT